MSKETTINSAQRCASGKPCAGIPTGLSNQELAAMTGESPTSVSRALATLMTEDLVVRFENGRYAHGIATLQLPRPMRITATG